MNTCMNCGSKNIIKNKVDSRYLYYCSKCNMLKYDKRKITSGSMYLYDSITEGVACNGSHKIEWELLINSIFKKEREGLSSMQQLIEWAGKNYLSYDFDNYNKLVEFKRAKPIVLFPHHKNELFSEYIAIPGIDYLIRLCAIGRQNDFSFLAYIDKKRLPYPIYNAPKSLSDTYTWGYNIYKSYLLSNPNALKEILKRAGY